MSRPFAFQPQRRFGRARGFTLVELMVAMTGGLFLSIVVFAVSRDASRFYQREIRVANATITGVSGFERLVSDLTRAGHMSTPNIELDPRICGRPDPALWPEALGRLRAVAIETGITTGLASTSEVLAAGYAPDALVISGALETTEELYSNTIEPIVGSAGFTIAINLLTPSAKRLGLTTGPGSSDGNGKILQAVFMKNNVGRIVRVRKDGLEQYAVVSSVTATDTVASVKLSDKPGLLFRKGGAANVKCGINDEGGGYSISIISIVRYNIRSMTTDPDYKYLFDASGRDQVPFEDTRAELTRVELDAYGNAIPGTLEIVAEYAVDLQLRPWAAGSAANLPSLGAAEDYGPTSTLSQALRGMNVLLSVRSREATAAGSGGSDRNNIQLPTTPPQPDTYARLRTFQSDIPLRNLENANW
jgi:hypothetical protein